VVNLFWATCAILGIGMVFTWLPWLAVVIKFLGAAYLIWFGARLIVLRGAGLSRDPCATTITRRKAFLQGVATNIANPKSIAFYAAIFSAATPPHVSIETLAAMLGVVAIVASFWYGFVALALSHQRVADVYRKQKRWIDSVCGGVIILLGVRQMLR
jgi:threonine/homoserine/homoserine lactone efflux protein